MIILHAFVGADSVIYTDHFNDRGRAIGLLRVFVHASATVYISGFQTGVRGPKGVRDGFPRGPREDSEK